MNYNEFLGLEGIEDLQREIYEMMDDINNAVEAVEERSYAAARSAATVIAKEQQRLLSKKHPKFAPYIKVMEESNLRRHITDYSLQRHSFLIGYDSETLKEHFELIIIEFGRPGVVGAHTKKLDQGPKTITVTRRSRNGEHGEITYKRHLKHSAFRRNKDGKRVDSIGRIIGDFPSHISHIRAGFFLAKETAVKFYFNELYNIVKDIL